MQRLFIITLSLSIFTFALAESVFADPNRDACHSLTEGTLCDLTKKVDLPRPLAASTIVERNGGLCLPISPTNSILKCQ